MEYAQAAFYVRQGQAIIARQRTLIERLEQQGQDATSAKALLRQFAGCLEMFEEDYTRLKGELESAN